MHSGNLSQIAFPNMGLLAQIRLISEAKFGDDTLEEHLQSVL